MNTIYLKGDPGDTDTMEVWDADTGLQVLDITDIHVTVCVGLKTIAHLQTKAGVSHRVEVIPSPKPKRVPAGTKLFSLAVHRKTDGALAAEKVRYELRYYEVDYVGMPERKRSQDLLFDQAIAHQEFKVCGTDQTWKQQFEAAGAKMGMALFETLRIAADGVLKNNRCQSGSHVLGYGRKPTTSLFPPVTPPMGKMGATHVNKPDPVTPAIDHDLTKKDATKEVCEECGGAGEVKLLNITVPCSQGCPKP